MKEATELTRTWVKTWKQTGAILEKLRRAELKRLNSYEALGLLLGPVDFSKEPFRPKPTSGLVEQQAWFKRWRRV